MSTVLATTWPLWLEVAGSSPRSPGQAPGHHLIAQGGEGHFGGFLKPLVNTRERGSFQRTLRPAHGGSMDSMSNENGADRSANKFQSLTADVLGYCALAGGTNHQSPSKWVPWKFPSRRVLTVREVLLKLGFHFGQGHFGQFLAPGSGARGSESCSREWRLMDFLLIESTSLQGLFKTPVPKKARPHCQAQ